jgi:hypothetical protein
LIHNLHLVLADQELSFKIIGGSLLKEEKNEKPKAQLHIATKDRHWPYMVLQGTDSTHQKKLVARYHFI